MESQMILASTDAILVKQTPQNAYCQCLYSPRGVPSCILPLWEDLQDQKVGLTQTPFKLLPLHWDSACEILCAPFKDRVSASYIPPALPNISPVDFQSQMFWRLISPMQDPWAEEPDMGLRPLTPWGGHLQL